MITKTKTTKISSHALFAVLAVALIGTVPAFAESEPSNYKAIENLFEEMNLEIVDASEGIIPTMPDLTEKQWEEYDSKISAVVEKYNFEITDSVESELSAINAEFGIIEHVLSDKVLKEHNEKQKKVCEKFQPKFKELGEELSCTFDAMGFEVTMPFADSPFGDIAIMGTQPLGNVIMFEGFNGEHIDNSPFGDGADSFVMFEPRSSEKVRELEDKVDSLEQQIAELANMLEKLLEKIG